MKNGPTCWGSNQGPSRQEQSERPGPFWGPCVCLGATSISGGLITAQVNAAAAAPERGSHITLGDVCLVHD